MSETTDLLTCADDAPAVTIVRANHRSQDLLDTCAGKRTGNLLLDGAARLQRQPKRNRWH